MANRSRRDRGVSRALTERISLKTIEQAGIELRSELAEHEHTQRPLTRGDCIGAERPCPWVGCRHHLYLDVTEVGSIKTNFPTLEPWEMPQTCALDVAAFGGLTLDQVGELMNITRERARQLEAAGLRKLAPALADEPDQPDTKEER